MSFKNKKFILFPKAKANLERKLEVVVLPHPNSSVLCEFLFDSTQNEIYEIYELAERSNGIVPSAFFQNECISSLAFCGAMVIDPFFFLLSALALARNNKYVDKELPEVVTHYIDSLKLHIKKDELSVFNANESRMRSLYEVLLSDSKTLQKVCNVCDISTGAQKQVCTDSGTNKYTLNDQKLLEYLSERIIKAANISIERKLYFKEFGSNSGAINSNISLFRVPAQQIACDLLNSCIPKILTNITERLKRRFGELKTEAERGRINAQSNSGQQPKNQLIGIKRGPNKRPAPVISMQTDKRPHKSHRTAPKCEANGNILGFLKR
ncbi:Ribonuclease H2 subunit B [Cryptosporidium felis]|nr:Ribonuclease H2 subunit B [Cryptosporidium felis]